MVMCRIPAVAGAIGESEVIIASHKLAVTAAVFMVFVRSLRGKIPT